MFGFEKLLDTRTNEPNIAIGFELCQQYMCAVTMKKRNEVCPALYVETAATANPSIA